MTSFTYLPAGGESLSNNDSFTKLGDYFDRPDWWIEGAQAINAFFDQDPTPINTPDQQLDNLLQTLEPLRVAEGLVESDERQAQSRTLLNDEQRSSLYACNNNNNNGQSSDLETQIGSRSSCQTTPADMETIGVQGFDDTINKAFSRSRAPSPPEHQAFPQPYSNRTGYTKVTESHDRYPVILKIPEELEHTSANKNLSTSGTHTSDRSSPEFSIINGIATSSSILPSTMTTSTRQTSFQPESSNLAPQVSMGKPAASDRSLDGQTVSSATSRLAIATNDDNGQSLSPVAPDRDVTLENVFPHEGPAKAGAELPVHENSRIEPFDDPDPTGLQAVKDELSEEYRLDLTHSASILSQDDDVTVLHDPSLAAASFFPPNPYASDSTDLDYTTGGGLILENAPYIEDAPTADISKALNPLPNESDHEESQGVAQGALESASATMNSPSDSDLTSLPSSENQLPQSFILEDSVERPDLFGSPSPSAPLASPLTPPRRSITPPDEQSASHQEEASISATNVVPSTPTKPILKFGRVTLKASTVSLTGGKLWSTVEQYNAEQSGDPMEDEKDNNTERATKLAGHVQAKRKQHEPRSNEPPSTKVRLSAIPEDDSQSVLRSIEAPATNEDEAIDQTPRPSVQKGKGKAISRVVEADSPDELAPAPTDHLEPSAPKPFSLARPTAKFKAKPDRSTPIRAPRKKASTTTATKPSAGAKATRKAVGRNELAGLFNSPPRKAADKIKADVGGRLRSESKTPAPNQTTLHNNFNQPSDTNTDSIEPTGSSTEVVTTTAASVPAIDASEKHSLKRSKHALGGHELDSLGSAVVEGRTRSRNTTVEPTPEPKAKAPAKRVRNSAAKPAAAKVVQNPFALRSQGNGTPAASRKTRAKNNQENDQIEATAPEKASVVSTKRKREMDEKDAGRGGAKRASKRVAAKKAQE